MVSARDQVIETERLRLEPFAPAHSAGLIALDRGPEVMRFIGNDRTILTIRWSALTSPPSNLSMRRASQSR
jgi:hypothetical protein